MGICPSSRSFSKLLLCFLVSWYCLLSGCTQNFTSPVTNAAHPIITTTTGKNQYPKTTITSSKAATPATTFHLAAFSAIDVRGPIKVTIVGQQPKQNVTLMVAPEIARAVEVAVRNHTLTINAKNQLQPMHIRIAMAQPLQSLLARGAADVWAESVSNPNLVVTAQDFANIHLPGTHGLHAIQNDSVNTIAIHNIHSGSLLVGGKNSGKIVLSGKVNELITQLDGSALLDARQLKADTAHIKTLHNSAAYVLVTSTLYGFAYHNSNIYYAEHPRRILIDTHASGNVLRSTP